jgi:hypothetical protein
MSLFSTVAGGGLLGWGVRRFDDFAAAGTGAGTGAAAGFAAGAGADAGAGTAAGLGADAGAAISGALAMGRFVPGGGAGSFVGTIW